MDWVHSSTHTQNSSSTFVKISHVLDCHTNLIGWAPPKDWSVFDNMFNRTNNGTETGNRFFNDGPAPVRKDPTKFFEEMSKDFQKTAKRFDCFKKHGIKKKKSKKYLTIDKELYEIKEQYWNRESFIAAKGETKESGILNYLIDVLEIRRPDLQKFVLISHIVL